MLTVRADAQAHICPLHAKALQRYPKNPPSVSKKPQLQANKLETSRIPLSFSFFFCLSLSLPISIFPPLFVVHCVGSGCQEYTSSTFLLPPQEPTPAKCHDLSAKLMETLHCSSQMWLPSTSQKLSHVSLVNKSGSHKRHTHTTL